MPPCGNFGLLLIGSNETLEERRGIPSPARDDESAVIRETQKTVCETGGLLLAPDMPSHAHLYLGAGEESSGGGPVTPAKSKLDKRKYHFKAPDLLTPLEILESMTAMTEVRGGQAGGFSIIEHQNEEEFTKGKLTPPLYNRVRLVARKRIPLAGDLKEHYMNTTLHNPLPSTPALTCIGHTRFATSSINVVDELHPHEWSAWHYEDHWYFNSVKGKFSYDKRALVGVHITHNGDFDALDAYASKMTNSELGHWLERVLYVPNDTRGDSPKVAGLFDLMRTMGRWGPSARLAYVRVLLSQASDLCGGQQLGKDAPNVFPTGDVWELWGKFFNRVWQNMKDDVIEIEAPDKDQYMDHYTYSINNRNEKLMVEACIDFLEEVTEDDLIEEDQTAEAVKDFFSGCCPCNGTDKAKGNNKGDGNGDNDDDLDDSQDSYAGKSRSFHMKRFHELDDSEDTHEALSGGGAFEDEDVEEGYVDRDKQKKLQRDARNLQLRKKLKASKWTDQQKRDFCMTAVRGFLRNDIYTVLCEFFGRAEGSFGIQVHSSIEPGVVVIGSKGQPMSMSFDSKIPLVLFGSEAGALGVPIDRGSRWLSKRIDLDGTGEIARIGKPRCLIEGTYRSSRNSNTNVASINDSINSYASQIESSFTERKEAPTHLTLQCGIQIKTYSLSKACEATHPEILDRLIHVTSTPLLTDPKLDIISNDLDCIPKVLASIDKMWTQPTSFEYQAAKSLSFGLFDCIRERLANKQETIDLVISGVEASLWLAESFAADVKNIFPQINIRTLSSNKLLGLGLPKAAGVYFPGTAALEENLLSHKTCFLLISQSGQTFPSLHGTNTSSRYLQTQRLWLITATFNSRMEKIIRDDFISKSKVYHNDRVMNIMCGHRPAEPSSLVVAATWHTLSRLLLFMIKHNSVYCPEGLLKLPWDDSDIVNSLSPSLHASRHDKERKSITTKTPEKQLNQPKNLGSRSGGKGMTPNSLAPSNLSPIVANNNDESKADEGVSDDMAVSNTEALVDGIPPPPPSLVKTASNSSGISFESYGHHNDPDPEANSVMLNESMHLSTLSIDLHTEDKRPPIQMMLTDHCVLDVVSLFNDYLIPDVAEIVGVAAVQTSKKSRADNSNNKEMDQESTTIYENLVKQGQRWGEHIREPWNMIVLTGIYLIISVAFGLPLFGSLAYGILCIIRQFADIGSGSLSFSIIHPELWFDQPWYFTVIGAFIQLIDAIWFIYITKNLTRFDRWLNDRPAWARFGKRTLVIVDSPTNHQLLESFVSKLFSQSYSHTSLDVHGASGLDHFVHRFTHRVVRGVLIAAGRPDGRMGCLAKGEMATLLALKQAAFITNCNYPNTRGGSGPDMVTIGHNPFTSSLGLASQIFIGSKLKRRQFMEEYLYERLHLATRPFTAVLLKNLRAQYILNKQNEQGHRRWRGQKKLPHGCHLIPPESNSEKGSLFMQFIQQSLDQLNRRKKKVRGKVEKKQTSYFDSVSQFFGLSKSTSSKDKKNEPSLKQLMAMKDPPPSNDPASREAFSLRFDERAQQLQDRLVHVERLYESRIAALERYIAFCVMFHAMADHCNKPWLLLPWDMARSQSNLRIATTASPIPVVDSGHKDVPMKTKGNVKVFIRKLRKHNLNF